MMKLSGTLAASFVVATAALALPSAAHAGGPPSDGGGGGAAATPGSCSDADLAVTNGPVESIANDMRRVVVSFKNTSPNVCTIVGYPDANLVTAAGGVLVHVDPQPALAAHLLHLNPGDVASAGAQSSALDINGSGNPCPREGTLVVTAPRGTVAHTLPIALPICHATITSVGGL